jgi:hypothetical protein
VSETLIPYLEVFGCYGATEDGCEHEGDCAWGFSCGTCGRLVDDGPCPDHAPLSVPGLVLAECDAVPRHPHTFLFASDAYPPPCMYCSYDALQAAHAPCEHSRHGAWRRWRAVHRVLYWLVLAGVANGAWSTHDQALPGLPEPLPLAPQRLRARLAEVEVALPSAGAPLARRPGLRGHLREVLPVPRLLVGDACAPARLRGRRMVSDSPATVIRRAAALIRPEVPAVADWLDIEAAIEERKLPDDSGSIHPALRVARAYLGEASPADEAGIEAVKRAGREARDKHHGQRRGDGRDG